MAARGSLRAAAVSTAFVRCPSPNFLRSDPTRMSGRCLQLLDLPDAIIEQALSPSCTTRSLVSLAASCSQLRRLCLRAAEALLRSLCAAGTSEAALAMGAATIHDLARMCGRHPVIPEKFLAAVLERMHGPVESVSIAALQRLFIVFAASEPTLFSFKAGSLNDPGVAQPSYRLGNDDEPNLSDLPVVRVVDAALCYSWHCVARMVDVSHVDLALRQVFNLDVHPADLPFGPFNRRTCAMLDFTTDLSNLAQQEEDDDSSPDYEPGPDPPAPPEEFGLVGVTIDGVWFPSKESFFDDENNLEATRSPSSHSEVVGPFGLQLAYSSPCGDSLCECLHLEHWSVRPQQCMDALPLFELAVGQQEEGWAAASCFDDVGGRVGGGPAQLQHPMTSHRELGARRQACDRYRHREVHPDVANAVSSAARELACQQPSKWPKTCPHPAVIAEKGQVARLRALRRQGERDATATLALLGKHVVEGVYRDNWDYKDVNL